jgi:pyruvate kinase
VCFLFCVIFFNIYFLISQSGTAEVELVTGKTITVSTEKEAFDKCDENLLYVDYENIVHVVNIGSRVFIDDGLISLIVREKRNLSFLIHKLFIK